MATDDLKQTKAITKMRNVLLNLLPDMEEGEVTVEDYAPLPCSTCIHKECSVVTLPCVRCTSFVPGSKPQRDHRPSDKCYWEPDLNATRQQIKAYHKLHGVKRLDMYKKYPPVRCINSKCMYDNAEVFDRGLCKDCYKWLESFVRKDAQLATDMVLMVKLSRSHDERAMALELYSNVYTWDYFVSKCYCLPKTLDHQDIPIRSLWVYYDIARANLEAGDEATPTKTQLLERINESRLELLSNWLEIEEN